jgi:exocyst complex protein 7
VYGNELCVKLRIFITEKLIPAYGGLVGHYGHLIEIGRHPEKYIKYSVEDLESTLGDFFT